MTITFDEIEKILDAAEKRAGFENPVSFFAKGVNQGASLMRSILYNDFFRKEYLDDNTDNTGEGGVPSEPAE